MLDRVLDALAGVLPQDHHDAEFLADVLWLAAARTPEAGERDAPPADTPPAPGIPAEQPLAQAESRRPRPGPPFDGWRTGRGGAGPGAYGVYENLDGADPAQDSQGADPDGAMAVAAGRALPQAVELARSLRPFMRRFPRGRRSGLDIAATIDTYHRGGELLPVIGPLPEPWFEVVVVVDTHLSMEVWHDAIQEFTALLAGSGAFRRIHRWQMSTEPHPYVTDARGRLIRSRDVTSPDGRRIVLVVSDCVAPAWYGSEVWQMLRAWAGHASLSVANPLPPRLWHRTALDLPAVRVRNRLPGERNTALTVTVPPHLRSVVTDTAGCVAVPTLTLTAHSLNRWARGLVRGAPEGYEAVLVTPFGAPESFADPGFTDPGFTDPELTDAALADAGTDAGECTTAYGGGSWDDAPAVRGPLAGDAPPWSHDGDPRTGAEPAGVFLRTASRPAARLAAVCSPFQQLSLPLIQLIRQEVVPDATTSDVAELLMSGMLQIRAGHDGVQVITFREGAREPLAEVAGRHDAWHVLDVLSRHIAQRTRLPGTGLNAFAALDTDELPASLRPFAYATADVVAALRAGAQPERPPAGGEAGFGEGEFGGGGFGGPVGAAGVYGGPLPAMPDPAASAALLIAQLPAPGWHGRLATMAEVSRMLMSPWGWALPTDRVRLIVNRPASECGQALDTALAKAGDALLVHLVGPGRPQPPEDDAGPPASRSLMPEGLTGQVPVDHLVVIEDLCAPAPEPEPESESSAFRATGRISTTWITAVYEPAEDSGLIHPAFTDLLLRTAAEGVPSAAPLLTAEALALAVRIGSGSRWSRIREVRIRTQGPTPALVRNRALPERRDPGQLAASVERVLDRVRDEVGLDAWPHDEAAAAERILAAVLRVVARWLRRPPTQADVGAVPPLVGSLRSEGVDINSGWDFVFHSRAGAESPTTMLPIQLIDLSGGLMWDRQPFDVSEDLESWQADGRAAPLALMLVLGCRRSPDRQGLGQHVDVHRDDDLGSSVVTLRLPLAAEVLDAADEARPAGHRAAAAAAAAAEEEEEDGDAALVDVARQAVDAYCAALNEQAAEKVVRLSSVSALALGYAPEGLDDAVTVAVRADPATVTAGARAEHADHAEHHDVRARVTVRMVGMLPRGRLRVTPTATVLAEEGDFAFVSVDIALWFAFAWRGRGRRDLELRSVSQG